MQAEVQAVLGADSIQAAPALLGWVISVTTPEGRLSGRIVETEAYHQDDPASHSYRGLTKRTAPMFARAGTVYVYFTYGMHYCMNLVCGPEGRGEGVLLRALEPLEGLEIMRANRRAKSKAAVKISDLQLTNGPGKLTQALGVAAKHSGLHLDDNRISLRPQPQDFTITQTTRIGISRAVHQPWRFYITGNPFVSRPSQ